MARSAVLITVTGRVQGVGFRTFMRRQATALGVDGWVRNRRDGSVEISAIGEPGQIDKLVNEATTGPRLVKVEGITVRATDDDGTTGFHERPTV
jgi:acylphosphatase